MISFLAISALMKVVNKQKMKIGVGGALIQYHPTYHELLLMQLNELAPPNVIEVSLILKLFIVDRSYFQKISRILVECCKS